MKTEKKVNYENTKANETNNRIYSLSPNNFDRSKLLAMMKNYTYKNPNQRRIISPNRRVFSNDRIHNVFIQNPSENNTCHHIDLEAIKKNLVNKTKNEKHIKPKPKISENIWVEDLFWDSSFNKPLKEAGITRNRKKQLKKLISDSEIAEIRNQIWYNINQKKGGMEL